MLVLARKVHTKANPLETVVLLIDGKEVGTVSVLKSSEGRVRLGIDAPEHVRILRGEVWEVEKNGGIPEVEPQASTSTVTEEECRHEDECPEEKPSEKVA